MQYDAQVCNDMQRIGNKKGGGELKQTEKSHV